MRGSKGDIPVSWESSAVVVRELEWGEIRVGFATYHQVMDLGLLLKGSPDDRCQCPHWGYVLKGRMQVRYADHEEVVTAGDAYYLAPGHIPLLQAGTEIVEFSPRSEYQKMMEVTERNFAAMQQGARVSGATTAAKHR